MTDDATLWRDGNARAAGRDWPAAIQCFRALAERHPDDAAAWIALAKASERAGEHRASHHATMAAVQAGPATWPHALALARLLRVHHEIPALVALAAAMPGLAPDAPVPELVELADLLVQADALEPAMALLDQAVARDPASASAVYLRGTARLFLGDFAGARADLEQAVALAPHFAHAHWRLAELRGQAAGEGPARVQRLQAERAQVPPGSEHDIHFSFSLHAELHELGRHGEAWDALERGCRAKRASLRYDPAVDRRLFAALEQACDAGFVQGQGHDGAGEPVPVFIVGLFRSGTTLLERLLAGHDDLADGGETLGYTARLRLAVDRRCGALLDEDMLRRAVDIDHAALGADFMAASRWRARGRAAWTEKLPSNFLNLGLIARALPRARFLHCRRDPRDVCFSNLRTLYGGICLYSYDQQELADYHAGYRHLMAHWRRVLGERLLDVSHAQLVQDPEAGMRRVLAHCGLDWQPGVLALGGRGGAVSTASAAQVREGIRAPSAPAWLPYEARLQPLFTALAQDGAPG